MTPWYSHINYSFTRFATPPQKKKISIFNLKYENWVISHCISSNKTCLPHYISKYLARVPFQFIFFWPKSKFLLRRQMLWHQTLNQETLSLCVKYLCLKWTSQFEGIVVGIFQMCVILSCARGSIEVMFSADDVCGWNSLWRFNLLFVRSSSSD